VDNSAGTYILVFINSRRFTTRVGSLGQVEVPEGIYLYVGSAFGPGGLRARVARHTQVTKLPRWHLDYVRPQFNLDCVWYSHDPSKPECAWSQSLSELGGHCFIPRFGSSDCRCISHLYHFDTRPELAAFRRCRPETIYSAGAASIRT